MIARHGASSTQSFPLRLAITGIVLMVVVAVISAVATWYIGTKFRSITTSQIAVITASERLHRYGDALVSSTQLAVATGDIEYVKQYRTIQPQLRLALAQLRRSIKLRGNAVLVQQVDEADTRATRIEQTALNLVLSGRRNEASRLLEGREYQRWVELYYEALTKIKRRSEAFLAESQRDLRGLSVGIVLLSLGGLPLAALVWLFLIRPARRWGEELEIARRQAEAAGVAKSDFLASMSHEMRTPLNSIIGFTDVLLEDQSLDERQRRQISLVYNSGSALLSVINDVLDFSKIEAGKIDLHSEPFATEALIDNSVSITRGSAEAKGLVFEVRQDPRLSKYYVGDENRLRQILLNLINNAIKFTHAGGVTLSIVVERSVGAADTLRLSVADTGEGVPEDKQDRLFQSFSQADSTIAKRHGGTGLGLAISKRLIEAMGGAIGVESKEGEGSTFWFMVTLPQAKAPPAPARDASSLKPVRAARILLVEDIPVNQELACVILRKDGHEVDTADDGEEAVEAARRGVYDLILMDIQMPKVDGITATKMIRAFPGSLGKVPIIAMTANVLPEQVATFMDAGMDDHVGKPIKQVELKRAINRALELPKWRDQSDVARENTPPFNAEIYENARTLLPPGRLKTHLQDFDRQLAEVFGSGAMSEDIEQAAHKLVSQAGMLGFVELSERCRELEQSCTDEEKADQVFEKAKASACEAKRKTSQLIDDL